MSYSDKETIFYTVAKAEKEESAAGERTLRKRGTVVLTGLLPEATRKPRKQLSPEELEARRKKVSNLQQKVLVNNFLKDKVVSDIECMTAVSCFVVDAYILMLRFLGENS